MPRCLSSARTTCIQNFAPSVSWNHIPSTSRSPSTVTPKARYQARLLSSPRGSCHHLHEVGGQAVANEGFEALARADWQVARERFEAAVGEGDESPELLDALGRALWWLHEPQAAVVQRRAFAGFRRAGDLPRAARIALWLSREYAQVWRNDAAANGWLARAERLLRDVAPGAESGWLALARCERAHDSAAAADLAVTALAVAVRAGDADLELRALAQLGLAEVSRGAVDQGLAHLDEAMAAATGGESPSLETFADVCCTLLQACALAGDDGRPKQWAQVFESFARSYDHVPLLAFCRSCGAGISAASGRIDEAERELVAALREPADRGAARCDSRRKPVMKGTVILAAVAAAAAIGVPGAGATAPPASCVATLTSFEAHLAPEFVGAEVSAGAPVGALASTLAKAHLGSLDNCAAIAP
jgi:tetratricopeptide (TPR) repeat protein